MGRCIISIVQFTETMVADASPSSGESPGDSCGKPQAGVAFEIAVDGGLDRTGPDAVLQFTRTRMW